MKKLVVAGCAALALCAANAETYTWNAGTTGNWEDPANWSPSTGYPVAGDSATITAAEGAAFTVTVNDPLDLESLTVSGSGETFATVKFQTGLATNKLGTLAVNAGGKLTHASGGSVETQKLILQVTGNATVAEAGYIDAKGCGYSANKGPGSGTGPSNWKVGSYGGEGAEHTVEKCYGSIRYPDSYGSGGEYASGGGAIRLMVGGKLTVAGTVTAQGSSSKDRSGSGGSVWIDCGELAGGGVITADGSEVATFTGGGGRVAVKLTKTGATFDDWTGKMLAVAHVTGSCKGAAGTVYQQTAAQADGFGTLIVDNAGKTSSYHTSVNENVTEADVGDVIVRNGGRLRISPKGTLAVRGSITNSGTITCETGSTLVLAGGATCNVAGKVSAYRLVCKEPGKQIVTGTTANDGLTIQADGELTLAGSEENPLQMLPGTAAGKWVFTVSPGVIKAVQYVSISNCNGSAGQDVTDFGGTDLGGNSKWIFPPPLVPGATNAWTGTASSDLSVPANWQLGRAPEPSDVILIPSGTAHSPVLTAASTAYNTLVVESGAVFTLDGARLVITNNLSVSGKLVVKGARTVEVYHDLTFAGPTCCEPDALLLKLTGASAHRVDANGANLGRFELTPDCGNVAFPSGWKAVRFRSRPGDAARSLTFADGALYEAEGWILEGGAAQLSLASSTADPWRMKVGHYAYVRGVSVSGCDAQGDGGIGVTAYESSGTGTNVGWTFAEGLPFVWKGTKNADFTADGNWEGGVAPGASDTAWVFEKGVNAPVASAEATVGALVVGGGEAAATFRNTSAMTVTRAFHVIENGTATCDALLTVAGSVRVAPGGALGHSSNDYLEMDVSGDMTVDEGGEVNLVGLSTSTRGRASGDWQSSYGGEGKSGSKAPCFGSIRHPDLLGTKGDADAGGGRIRAVIGGTLTVNGAIHADGKSDYRTGTGGSVWIDCGWLVGYGKITADAGKGSQFSSAGGRVALKLTDPAADFSAWTGQVTAYGKDSSAAGTVYLQSGAQEDGFGTLIVDNNKLSSQAYTVVNTDVTEADVGDVIIRGAGRLRIDPGATLTVNGSITNNGVFTSAQGAAVELCSTNDCYVMGNELTFATLKCRVPGKTLRMANGSVLSVLGGGTMQLTGVKGNLLTMVPVEPTAKWNLQLGAGTVQTVEYVAVSNSTANVDIIDVGGVDLGGNSEKWAFVSPIEPGEVITWTGAAGSTDWGAKDNWDLGRVPIETDTAVVDVASGDNYPVLTAGEFIISTITVRENATLTFSGVLPTITNLLEVAGTLVTKGHQKIICQGDVMFKPGAIYVSEGSATTFALSGAREKLVTLNGQKLFRILIDADAGNVVFADDVETRLFRNVPGVAARTILFAANSMLTTDGLVADGGSAGLTMGGASGAAWHLAAKYFVYAKNALAPGCDRPLETSGFVWDGGTANFNVPGNWGGTVPGAGDGAFIPSGTVTVSAGQSVGDLVVGGFGVEAKVKISAPLSVTRALCFADGATVTSDKPVTVGGDFTVYDGASVNQSAGTYIEYDVAGRAEVCCAGQISGHGAGNVGTGRTASDGQSVSCYGGLGIFVSDVPTAWKCYGSIANPTNLGTLGDGGNGGGRIRLIAKEDLQIDGAILCNPVLEGTPYRVGSGGSVWITCAKLTGWGCIKANGMAGQFYSGAGRLAIEQTEATDFSEFKGDMEARDQDSRAGAGTICKTSKGKNPQVVVSAGLTGSSKVVAYTQIPGYTDADKPKQLKTMEFVIRDGARVRLMSDLTIRDLDLQTKNVELDLNGYTLTIRSPVHKERRGWAEGAIVSTTGQIVWKPVGFVISIR